MGLTTAALRADRRVDLPKEVFLLAAQLGCQASGYRQDRASGHHRSAQLEELPATDRTILGLIMLFFHSHSFKSLAPLSAGRGCHR